MGAKEAFTKADAARVMRELGIRSREFGPAELARGMNVEYEHRAITHGDPIMTARIALDHLHERPDYYEVLERAESAPVTHALVEQSMDPTKYMRLFRERRKEQGLCTACGLNPQQQGFTYCEQCRERFSSVKKKLREDRKAKGLCQRCGNPASGSVFCDLHQEERREIERKMRERKRMATTREEPETRSFGYDVILSDRPDLEYDLGELPPKLIESGSIDDIATELEIMGSERALTVRTNALKRVGEWIKSYFSSSPITAVSWLRTQDKRIASWAAITCARLAVQACDSHKSESIPLLMDAELYLAGLRGNASLRRRASRAARGGLPFDYATAHAVVSTLPKTREDAASEAVEETLSLLETQDIRDKFGPFELEGRPAGDESIMKSRYLTRMIVEALPGMPVRAQKT